MSWIRRRPLAALAGLALALRVACAVATEFNPIFPAYYYTDANVTHAYAISALEDARTSRRPIINGGLGARIQTLISFEIYRAFGPKPFIPKIFNAFLGTLAVTVFAWALSMIFSAPVALAAGLGMAVWPSHIFYTSQNLKEAPTILLAYAALGAALASGFDGSASHSRAGSFALSAGLALLGAGFYRSYIMVCMAAALLTTLILSASRPPRTNALLAAAALATTLAIYPFTSRELLGSFYTGTAAEDTNSQNKSFIIPVKHSDFSQEIYRPTSPRGISLFRSAHQSSDRLWAMNSANREIGTQIYPNETFKTWLDILIYLPKGAFTVLFMPLPGLYPMDGKLGRWAAAGENAALLLLSLFATAGFVHGRKTPARLALLGFFTMMTVGAALLEFDLGSAGRHKLLYLPMLFPFAAEEALRLLGRKEAA